MHVAATLIFDAGSVATPGGIDFEQLCRHVEQRLSTTPRLRQRLEHVPLEGHPVWVDHTRFSLGSHVRHTSLPRPGDLQLLKRLSGRVMSQKLDRGKPLWEMWIVEGLENGSFALILKAHHCAVDGVGGAQLLSALLDSEPHGSARIGTAPVWLPRPAPSRTALLRDALAQRALAPLRLAASLAERARDPGGAMSTGRSFLGSLWQAFGAGLTPAPATPLNRPIGPHRRFDWLTFDLEDVKEVKNRLGGTVNDVVLATVAGGLRKFFKLRDPGIQLNDLRVLVPVNTRGAGEAHACGNHVSGWLVSLPVREWHPMKRFEEVREVTARLRASPPVTGLDFLAIPGGTFLALGARFIEKLQPFNLVVTNVPGPPSHLHLVGARLREVYPQVPLFPGQGLGIALLSYAGKLHWGFNADCHIVPDLQDLVRAIAESFADLQDEARGGARATERAASERTVVRRIGARTIRAV
jgi:WS/DGAT/MGAT family acyltransferase